MPVCAHMCSCACWRANPPLVAFTSTAIEHLCLALLLVATVTKAQTGVAAAARVRARHRARKQRERGEDFFACRPDHSNKFKTTHEKTQFICSAKQNAT